jgi:colanic acid/amylovoran biosynthesis glycosyltransferase
MKSEISSSLPVVAHIKTPFLYATETFIYRYVSAITGFRSAVITGFRENREEFPWDDVIERRRWPKPLQFFRRGIRHFVNMKRPDDPLLRSFYKESLTKLRPDVVHAHFGLTGLAVAPIVKAQGLPLIVSFYGADLGLYPKRFGQDMYLRRGMFERTNLCTAEGPHAAKMLENLGCPPEKIAVLPIGIDLDRIPFHERRIDPGEPAKILFCGRLIPKKGLDVGLRAFKAVCGEHRVTLEIVGDGPMNRSCRRLVRELGIGDKVRFWGSVRHGQFMRICSEAQLLLAPSRTDRRTGDTEGGAPTVLLEGQASGLPVVATRHADIPNVVREGESAILADEGDVEGLAKALDQALRDRDRWPEMGRAGRALMESNHSIRTIVRKLENLYRVGPSCREEPG